MAATIRQPVAAHHETAKTHMNPSEQPDGSLPACLLATAENRVTDRFAV
jgi:hypothetical protein